MVRPIVNAPEPVFWIPPAPTVIVCTPAAEPSVTPKFDAMFNPNNEMLEFSTGLCANVSPLAKSAVVVPSGKTPPTHEVPRLKFVAPLTQLMACAGLIGKNPRTNASTTPNARPKDPRKTQKNSATGKLNPNR